MRTHQEVLPEYKTRFRLAQTMAYLQREAETKSLGEYILTFAIWVSPSEAGIRCSNLFKALASIFPLRLMCIQCGKTNGRWHAHLVVPANSNPEIRKALDQTARRCGFGLVFKEPTHIANIASRAKYLAQGIEASRAHASGNMKLVRISRSAIICSAKFSWANGVSKKFRAYLAARSHSLGFTDFDDWRRHLGPSWNSILWREFLTLQDSTHAADAHRSSQTEAQAKPKTPPRSQFLNFYRPRRVREGRKLRRSCSRYHRPKDQGPSWPCWQSRAPPQAVHRMCSHLSLGNCTTQKATRDVQHTDRRITEYAQRFNNTLHSSQSPQANDEPESS